MTLIKPIQSNIRSLGLRGYVGGHLNGNIRNWQLGAYASNRGIVEKIAAAKESLPPKDSFVIWYGEFVGKLLTGMAFCYKASAVEDLRHAAEEIISDLCAAQGEDGYLGVFSGGARYSLSRDNWDLWNQYHCITGLLEWYKLTNNETALSVAKKCLDRIYHTFKDRSYIVTGGFETNRGIAHGYAQMYQITRDIRYLKEAERIIRADCREDKDGWYPFALAGRDFADSNCTRWEVLHMVMTLGILYEETGNTEYYDVMGAVWESILHTDVHNSGSFTTNEGACGDPFAEGIVESCCTIAWAALTNEYLKYNKTVRVADELERSYFNGILGSLLPGDRYCTYNTPQNGIKGSSDLHGGVYDGRRVPSQKDISFQYNIASPDMNCCQANIARGLGQIAEWAVMGSGKELYLNYYGPCCIETEVDGSPITLTQTTEYPRKGEVKIEISNLPHPKAFTLYLRIPTWAVGTTVRLDGKTAAAKSGEYYPITRTWQNGDMISLDIPLPFRYLTGQRAQTGYTSLFYGPVLLALDKSLSPSSDQSTVLYKHDIEAACIDKDQNSLLRLQLPPENAPIQLISFSDAGKFGTKDEPSTYWSWLTIL